MDIDGASVSLGIVGGIRMCISQQGGVLSVVSLMLQIGKFRQTVVKEKDGNRTPAIIL